MELYTVQTRRPLAYTVRDDVISALGSGPGTCTRSLCVLAGAWLWSCDSRGPQGSRWLRRMECCHLKAGRTM